MTLITKSCWPFALDKYELKIPPQISEIKQLQNSFSLFHKKVYLANSYYQNIYSSFTISFKLTIIELQQKYNFDLILDIDKASILLLINTSKSFDMMVYKLRIKEEELQKRIEAINKLIQLINKNSDGVLSLNKVVSIETLKDKEYININNTNKLMALPA